MNAAIRRILLVCSAFCCLVVLSSAGQTTEIRRVSRPLPGRYIVVLHPTQDPLAVGLEAAATYDGRLRHIYSESIRGFAIDLSVAAARALASDARVEYVEEDGIAVAAATRQNPPSWGLDRIDQRRLPLDHEYRQSRDAGGVNVYVVDSGIRLTHSEFGGRAFIAGDHIDEDGDGDFGDLGNDDGNPAMPDGDDCNGHGTHVAATIGGFNHGVAKGVTLWAHRVLDCHGAGATSDVIAAVDAISADTERRPAVVNISVTAPASTALDAAVRRSIAAGLTYVVAAGNDNADTSNTSPARVADAITVGAVTSEDGRATFSNFGPGLDLFAPGVSILSASLSELSATTMSGTSSASAHAAGVAALYLERHPNATPSAVQNALVATSTRGSVVAAGAGSPNRLLHSVDQPSRIADPFITIAPSTLDGTANARWGYGTLQRLAWDTNLGPGDRVDLVLSVDGGKTFPIVLASGVSASAKSADIVVPVLMQPATDAHVQVRWSNLGETSVLTTSPFTIQVEPPFVRVTRPNGGETWESGTIATIRWDDNLGMSNKVSVALSRNGGVSYDTVIKPSTNPDGRKRVTVESAWATATARVRVTWITDTSVKDASDANFRIVDSTNAPPTVSLTAPPNGATFVAPATITMSANASDTDGAVTRVDFYRGSTLVGTDTTSPYSATWNNVPVGSYSLTAVATDNDGATTTSSARSVTVTANQPPTVSLTAPADGATFTAPATITISANASDTDGSVVRVDFYRGTTLIGPDATNPYSIVWISVAPGTYSLTAVATDNGGATRTSQARTITVNPLTGQRTLIFTASPDHNTLVNSYLLEIFLPGVDTKTATPLASLDVGKPPVVSGDCTADVTATIIALVPGIYQATVASVGSGGKARSDPFNFTR